MVIKKPCRHCDEPTRRRCLDCKRPVCRECDTHGQCASCVDHRTFAFCPEDYPEPTGSFAYHGQVRDDAA